ncbi:hypothetical protein ACFSGX_03990 [Sphingomonas arantia]|uniref:Uncharacterized protein n=1 Tax=Sphingomonas arantia TaxID=1460676 RepID=A0ABW4TVJ5_9SPHN
MIVSLLVLIVLILLFGAAAVKGWMRSAAVWIVTILALLFAFGCVANKYAQSNKQREHAELVSLAYQDILKDVAIESSKPVHQLTDRVTYDSDYDLYVCGSILGTSGYGGPNGRQRFLSNGGNTELERLKASVDFDVRVALHCTNTPELAAGG